MPDLVGISHVELTVSDCDKAAEWWHDVMGFWQVHRSRAETCENRDLIHPTGVTIAVKIHDVPLPGAFDERRIGLDHISFQVADRDELQRWVTHLESKGIAHSGIKETELGPLVVFRDPDNIQIELFVHPSPEEAMRLLNEANSAEAQRVVRQVGEQSTAGDG